MNQFTVRGADGSVDVAASAQAYTQALTQWITTNEIPSERISNAVNVVLDRFPGQRLSMPSLLSFAVQELGATPEQHKALTERVHAFVKGQATVGVLTIAKGKGGGVGRAVQSA
jgi:hypothetical protein